MDPLAFTGVFLPACFGIFYGLVIGRVLLYLISAVEKIGQAWSNRQAKLADRRQPATQRPAAVPASFGRKPGRAQPGRLARV